MLLALQQRSYERRSTNTFIDIQSDLLKKTTVSFRTAYTVAKERLSYKKLNPFMTMQELNGAEVGNIHKSDHACAEIISHIVKEMRCKFVCNVKEMDLRVSITIDESTIHGSPYLIIYVRCDVSGKVAPDKHCHRWSCGAHRKRQWACC